MSTRYKKGLDFENEVAKFMTSELNYEDAEVRPRVSGKYTDRGYELDVLARRSKKAGQSLRDIGFGALIFGALMMVAVGLFADESLWAIIPATIMVIGVFYIYSSGNKNLNTAYTWIECKNHKTTVKRTVISELIHKFNDYKSQAEKKWNIDSLMVFSNSGFDHDAKMLAEKENIILYERNDKGYFIKTKLNF